MSKPIYQLFIGNNNIAANLAWKAMPEAVSKELQEKERASRETCEVKQVVMCNSAWADESQPWWGVLRFPSLEARIEHTRNLQKIGWLDIVDAFSLLGTSTDEPGEVTLPNPIYDLWVIKKNPAAAQANNLPKGLETLIWEKHDALYKDLKGESILYCDSSWCNEAYPGFGISVFPDIDAHMRLIENLNGLGWPRWIDSFSLLGISE